MNMIRPLLSAVVAVLLCAASYAQPAPKSADEKLSLNEGWALQSSAKVSEKGEAIAAPSFQPKDWIKANVPSTVVAVALDGGLTILRAGALDLATLERAAG